MSSPVVVEIATVLPGPPGVVWSLITDWEHQDDWMLEASDFVVTSEQRQGVGVEAEATIDIGGIKTRDAVRVIGWERNRRLVIQHLGWVTGTGEIQLTALENDETYLWWREELVPPWSVLGAAGMTAFRPLLRRTFERDLRVLQGLVRAATLPCEMRVCEGI